MKHVEIWPFVVVFIWIAFLLATTRPIGYNVPTLSKDPIEVPAPETMSVYDVRAEIKAGYQDLEKSRKTFDRQVQTLVKDSDLWGQEQE